MKAIETFYNGYRCRSRAEARWMILLDSLGISYTYEPEGYQFKDNTRYLPDFYLNDQDAYLEIKGVMQEKDEHKIEQLCIESESYVFVGMPDLKFYVYSPIWKQWFENGEMKTDYRTTIAEKSDAAIRKCRKCGKVYFKETNGSWECEVCQHYDGDAGFETLISGEYGAESQKGELAIIEAKSARFEYGEHGANKMADVKTLVEKLRKKAIQDHDPVLLSAFMLFDKGEPFGKALIERKIKDMIYMNLCTKL